LYRRRRLDKVRCDRATRETVEVAFAFRAIVVETLWGRQSLNVTVRGG
jgi:hypothetical protein